MRNIYDVAIKGRRPPCGEPAAPGTPRPDGLRSRHNEGSPMSRTHHRVVAAASLCTGALALSGCAVIGGTSSSKAVSYTHLTLPTIYSV